MLKAMFILAATLAYLAFPIDFVPDLIPIIGQMDDLGILFAGSKAAYSAWKGKKPSPPSIA